MTRILQVTTLPITMRLFVLPLAEVLAANGCHVELACRGADPGQFNSFPAYSVFLSRSPFHPLNGRGLAQLIRLMRARRYDLVHLHTPVAGLVGRLAARLTGVPRVVYTLHGSFWGTRPAWRTILFDQLERLAAQWTNHAFVFNDEDATDLQRRCRLSSEKITRLPVGGAGVDLTLFDPAHFSADRVNGLRQELGLSPSDVVIGYVGRMDRDKGIAELLLSFAQLRRSTPRLRLLLIGDRVSGDRDALIDALLAEEGSAVICPGFRSDVPAMLACMDFIVSPSYRDGFGMVLAEAAAMGKAVVSTATRGARSAVVDEVTGLLVPPGDIEALARAIRSLISQASRRAAMGLAARQLARERFDRDKVLELYQVTYASLLLGAGKSFDGQVLL